MKLFRYLLPLTTLSLYTISNFASITTATAQIIPDNSLGVESSTVNPDVINGIQSDRVSGGAIRGSNLFHSFQEFNIDAGRGAYFSNPANITNILTRVTGGNPSNILGRLGVLGNANLFLINPKGVFLGLMQVWIYVVAHFLAVQPIVYYLTTLNSVPAICNQFPS